MFVEWICDGVEMVHSAVMPAYFLLLLGSLIFLRQYRLEGLRGLGFPVKAPCCSLG